MKDTAPQENDVGQQSLQKYVPKLQQGSNFDDSDSDNTISDIFMAFEGYMGLKQMQWNLVFAFLCVWGQVMSIYHILCVCIESYDNILIGWSKCYMFRMNIYFQYIYFSEENYLNIIMILYSTNMDCEFTNRIIKPIFYFNICRIKFLYIFWCYDFN